MPEMQQVPLQDLVHLVADKTLLGKDLTLPYVGLEHMESGSPDLRGHALASDSISTNSVFAAGDTLFGKLRPNLRKTAIAPFKGYCSTDILVLRATAASVPRFIARLMQSEVVSSQALRTAIGTKMPRTSWRALRKLPVHAPPLIEQSWISEIADRLDEAIRRTDQLVNKLALAKQGLLDDLLTRGIDANGEVRDFIRHPEQFRNSSIGTIPATWKALPLSEATSAPICYGIVQPGAYCPNGVFVVTIGDLNGDYRTGLHKADPIIDQKHLRSRTQPGDLLLSIKGTIGRTGIIPDSFRGNISRDLARFRFSSILPQFAHYYFASPVGKQRLGLAVVGTTRAELSIRVLTRIGIPQPPHSEQQEIVTKLASMDQTIVGNASFAAKLRLLKQALMDDLLTGRIRVTPLLEKDSTL